MSGCWSLRGARRTPHASGTRASDPCPSRRGRPSQWASNLLMFERQGRSGARTICLALVRWHISVSVVGPQARRRLHGPVCGASISAGVRTFDERSGLVGGPLGLGLGGVSYKQRPTDIGLERVLPLLDLRRCQVGPGLPEVLEPGENADAASLDMSARMPR